jgi:hypothetical protein
MWDDLDDPDLWETPDWHPDWDGAFTFDGLRACAKALLRGNLTPELTIVEDGYAHLDVFSGPTRVGLVYVNRGDNRETPKFSVYAGAGDDELHTEDVEAAVAFMQARRTAFPEGPR